MSIIEIRDLTKQFKKNNSMLNLFRDMTSANASTALENISLSLTEGESLGVIGKNGAGKSTLAKIITDTLTPTQGEIYVKGTVHALLELGLGAHPEFSARENQIN